jgi:hypothetical protein
MANSDPAVQVTGQRLGTQHVTSPTQDPEPRVSFADAFRFWVKLGFINFGGPARQIAIMHRELVDHRRWVPEPFGCVVRLARWK